MSWWPAQAWTDHQEGISSQVKVTAPLGERVISFLCKTAVAQAPACCGPLFLTNRLPLWQSKSLAVDLHTSSRPTSFLVLFLGKDLSLWPFTVIFHWISSSSFCAKGKVHFQWAKEMFHGLCYLLCGEQGFCRYFCIKHLPDRTFDVKALDWWSRQSK